MRWLLSLFLLSVFAATNVEAATTRYVIPGAGSTGCSNGGTNYDPTTNTCGSGSARVYTSIDNALAANLTVAGDILDIRAGTYTEKFDTNTRTLNSGTSYSNAVTFQGHTGETVILNDGGQQINIAANNTRYIIFKNLELSGGYQNISVGSSGSTADHIKFDNIRAHDGSHQCVNWGENTGFIWWTGGKVYNCGLQEQVQTVAGYNFYISGDDNIVEYAEVYQNNAYCFHIWSSASAKPTRNTVRYNLVHHCGLQQASAGAILFAFGDNNIAYRNVLYSNSSHGILIQGSTTTNAKVYHNTIYGGSQYAVKIVAGATGTLLTNNIFYQNANTVDNGGTGTVQTTNRTTNPSFTNAASADFTLLAGSVAIDAGTAITGFPYNGSLPDQGAFETFVFSSCAVAAGTPGVINVTFTNNVAPPLLPSTGVTTFTARKAGANDVVTGVTRTGDNQLDIALTDNIAAGNTVDISWSSGNLTDSSLNANVTNQKYVQTLTNQSCTNNVAGAPSYLFIQAAYEWHGLRGTEAIPVLLRNSGGATENLDITTYPGGKARLRFAITCSTADCPADAFYPYVSVSGGAYGVVPDAFGEGNIKFCGTDSDPDIPLSGAPTTDQLSTSGTFVAGAVVRTSNAIPNVDLDDSPATKTELEYCFAWDTDIVDGTTYDFRLRRQDGTVLDTYTVTPRATVAGVTMGVGF